MRDLLCWLEKIGQVHCVFEGILLIVRFLKVKYCKHVANTGEFLRVVLKESKWSFVLALYQPDPLTFFVEP